MAVILNLTIDQGATFSKTFTIYATDTTVLNLTGYTIRGEMRKAYAASTSQEFTISCPEPTTGVVTISLTATQTAALTAGKYVYDVETSSPAGTVSRTLQGNATVTPEVTRTATGIVA